ncbi:hypothetical protein AGOR_G00195650 [Albula goreensis]|uniref:ATP synthase subunit f, mitochondrial n=1 Tax=Albula goreensis TaxID=1534307 RepID=A0A8T3CRS5_9TELE|nr:hypothetical protein AGOR_G00195650 [Albula goreensis]
MTSDEKSERDLAETCPFCGRSFKRLKSHITRCKMAPVAKDPKSSKPSKLLTSVAPALGGMTAKKKTKKTTLNQKQPADAWPGSILKSPKEARMESREATVDQGKNNQKGKGAPTGRTVKVQAQEQQLGRVGEVESKREAGHWGGQQHGPGCAGVSKPPVKTPARPVDVSGAPGTHTATAEGPLCARGKVALPRSQPSPAKGLKLNLPKSSPPSGKLRSAQSPPSLRAGAKTQSMSQDSFGARVQVIESALQRPPHVRRLLWEDVPGSMPGAVTGSGGWGWSKTSVWEHINEALTCRSPAHTYSGSRDQVTVGITPGGKGTAKLIQMPSAVCRDTTRLSPPAMAGAGGCLETGLRAASLQDSPPLEGLLTPPPQPDPGSAKGPGWGSGRGTHSPLGLEEMTHLAATYRGISLSMIPLQRLTLTEQVQQKAPPTQPLTQGSAGPAVVPLAERALMDVRLSELPEWLTLRPLSPRQAAAIVHRGWLSYYRKYIDVRRGGVGGVTMLVAGYCVLSYIWSYPHLKCDRWRKYH